MKAFPVLSLAQFPADNKDDFYANDFAHHLETHHKDITKPHKHDFYLTILFTRGSGFHEVDFHSYEVKRGSVFMINPGQTHYWEFSSPTDGYVLFHTKAFYDLTYTNRTIDNFPFFYSLQNSPHLFLEQERMEAIELLFHSILQEYRGEEVLKYQKICSLTDLLYTELTREYLVNSPLASNETPPLFLEKTRKLEGLIDEHYLHQKYASDYAEMMHMSTRHLNRITQSVLGKSPTDLITERIILEAQRMLSHSKTTVAEVADYLGYNDHAYFSRLFKKKLQVSPTDFAKRYR